MRLVSALGLPWEENFEPDSRDHESLFISMVDGSMDYLRAGGSISLEDWSGFSELEREAMAQAGDKLRALTSSLSGLAAQGKHASVMSVADGGAALVTETLERVLNEAESL